MEVRNKEVMNLQTLRTELTMRFRDGESLG